MARYIGPVCRLCRREGMKLFLKGERCHTEKCAIEKRNFVPGQHGKDRKPKMVGYGLQLREKQKARRYYGLLEGQFRNLFEKAVAHQRASPARTCCNTLERRLDNVDLPHGLRHQPRAGPPDGPPRPSPGQRPQGQHPLVRRQGRRRDRSAREQQEQSDHPGRARRHGACAVARTGSKWTATICKGRIIAQPKREELVQIQLNEQLIVELYSK